MSSENYSEIFNNIEKWLISHKFIILNKNIKPKSPILFHLTTHLPNDQIFYIDITLFKETNNYFLLHRNMVFDDSAVRSIDALPKGERERLFMNIRKLIYPLFVNLEMNWPKGILLLKELTIDSIKNNEQLFIEQVRNLRNAVELVKINFDEKHFELFPQGKKGSEDFK